MLGAHMRILVFTALISAAAVAPSYAQTSRHDGWSINGVHENDLVQNGNDRNYTTGTLISAVTHRNSLSDFEAAVVEATGFDDDFEDLRMELSISHAMFTPTDLTSNDPNDRPFAGMALFSVGFVGWNQDGNKPAGASGDRIDAVTFSLGLVGPASRADDIQSWLHDQQNGVDPLGWAEQVPNRMVGGVSYQQTRRLAGTSDSPIELFGHAGFSLGTIQTNASIGASVRVGWNKPHHFGLARVQPSLPGSGYFESDHFMGWYAFIGGEQRYVAYDVTLDEDPSTGPNNIARRDLVGDLQVGIMGYVGPFRLGYTHVWRSEQFRSQQEGDGFGALALGFSTRWGVPD